jgi:hypothetical protein
LSGLDQVHHFVERFGGVDVNGFTGGFGGHEIVKVKTIALIIAERVGFAIGF